MDMAFVFTGVSAGVSSGDSGAALNTALGSWTIPFWPTLLLVVTAVVYWRGYKQIRQSRRALFPSWRLSCFLGGLLSLWIAIASPLDTLDGLLLFMHMTQHLILMSIAPPLLLLGAPAVPLLRGLPRGVVRDGLSPFLRSRVLHRVERFLTHPVFAWLAMNIAFLGWHVPQAYELALRSPGWHQVEHGCFFVTSLLFWFPVIQPWPSVSQVTRWAMLPYLMTADLVNTALSAFLAFSGKVVYPTYAAVPRVFGGSAQADQAAAGALMWVAGSILFLAPTMAITMRLLSRPRTSPTGSVPGKIAASFAKRFDLLRAPVAGTILRARYGRLALQSVSFLIALAVIADGFFGHPMSAMNLAGILPWTFARALGVVALLVAGNVFCMACPFMLPREIGHRLGLARFRWPRALRGKWVAVALLVLFFWSYEAFGIWDHPARTAWVLIAYFAAAMLVDTFFRGASFCKYICPLGQFNFSGSLLSPLALEARDKAVCGSCRTRDCIAGNAQQRGCELELYMPVKSGNMDCTLCMDCVKACPHDNIGLMASAPGADLLHDPPRSSLRRFAWRVDIAVLAVVVVFAAFASAAVMVAPVAEWMQSAALWWNAKPAARVLPPLAASAIVSVLLLASAVSFFYLASAAGVWLVRRGAHAHSLAPKVKEIFCRLSLALLPLGFGMWAAHLLFHLLTGWSTLAPALVQAAHDLGWKLALQPRWDAAVPLLGTASILELQLLLLDAGLLATLYLGWRLARQWAASLGRAAALLLPWVLPVLLGYAAGLWILLEPMQMRGMMHP
jgi:cytochrome c oxidase assembly factor CtaG